MGTTTAEMIARFRQRIKDTRYVAKAMSLAVVDSGVSHAIAEITNGHLLVMVTGGTATQLDVDLSASHFDTIEKLYQHLSRLVGYRASRDEDVCSDHPSLDLESFGPTEIKGNGIVLRHRLFADSELERMLQDATRRHNAGFTLSNLPETEQTFVLTLAHSEVCRQQASDAAKRKGLDTEVSTFLELARSYEDAYQQDTLRNKRALQVPPEAIPNRMGTGDISCGSFFRRSPRTGYRSPIAANLPPTVPVFLPEEVTDAEDEKLRVKWERNRDTSFYGYELWMDTTPQVSRDGKESVRVTPGTKPTPRQTTSRMVYRAFGANSTNWAAFATIVEEMGQMVAAVDVSQLEPETTYYFRMYVMDLNREVTGSAIQEMRTKAMRTRFAQYNSVSPTAGPAGTVVTMMFDTSRAPVTSRHEIRLGDKLGIVPTVVSDYQATFVVPPMVQKGFKSLVVVSPNQLFERLSDVFRVM